MPRATIQALFLKPAKGHALVDVSTLGMTMQQGYGIVGDCQGHPLSPRQVLVLRCEDLEAFMLHPGDLRENIVLAGLTAAEFVPGAVLHVGKSVQIRLTFHCEPCKRIAHVLGRPIKEIVGKRGILGTVLAGGELRCGDSVVVGAETQPPLSPIPYNRFLSFIASVPYAHVVSYKEIVLGMGVANSFMRVIPHYLQKTDPEQYPIHRVVDTQGLLLPHYIPNQLETLRAEGIALIRLDCIEPAVYQLDLKRYGWRGK